MKLTELRHDYESTYSCTVEGLLSRKLLQFYQVFAAYHVWGNWLHPNKAMNGIAKGHTWNPVRSYLWNWLSSSTAS